MRQHISVRKEEAQKSISGRSKTDINNLLNFIDKKRTIQEQKEVEKIIKNYYSTSNGGAD